MEDDSGGFIELGDDNNNNNNNNEMRDSTPQAMMTTTGTMLQTRTSSDSLPMGNATTPSAATLAWKAQQEKKAKERDIVNEKKRTEMQTQALAKFNAMKAEREKRIAVTAAGNKKQAGESSVTGSGWAKIASLVDLEKESTDRERMRQVIKAKIKSG